MKTLLYSESSLKTLQIGDQIWSLSPPSSSDSPGYSNISGSHTSNLRVALDNYPPLLVSRTWLGHACPLCGQNDLQDSNQSGFKVAHTTKTALTSFMPLDLSSCHKSSSCLTFQQLLIVSHTTLLSILISHGAAQKWFASYLEGQSCQVTFKWDPHLHLLHADSPLASQRLSAWSSSVINLYLLSVTSYPHMGFHTTVMLMTLNSSPLLSPF